MSLITEDGSGKSDAQSYVTLAEANIYLDAHHKAVEWAALADAAKEKLLIRATRAIDMFVAFDGSKVTASQALAWPRYNVRYDGPLDELTQLPGYRSGYYPANKVPLEVKRATYEAAAFCMDSTPGAEWDGAGIKSLGLGDGAIAIDFDEKSKPAPLPPIVTSQLAPFLTGGAMTGKGSVRIRRA